MEQKAEERSTSGQGSASAGPRTTLNAPGARLGEVRVWFFGADMLHMCAHVCILYRGVVGNSDRADMRTCLPCRRE